MNHHSLQREDNNHLPPQDQFNFGQKQLVRICFSILNYLKSCFVPCEERFLSGMASGIYEVVCVAC